MLRMRLLVNDKWIEVGLEDLLNPVYTEIGGVNKETGMCRVCLKLSPDVYWHLGTSALVGYYSEFNMVERTISFTPIDTSEKLDIVSGSKPDLILGLKWQTVLWISLAMATLITLFVLLCMAVCCDKGPFYKNRASRST